jgi:regulator of protease activity HflC (stomatin/prohibitin superfamily)
MTTSLVVVGLLGAWLLVSVHLLDEYEWGVVFRRGVLLPKPRGPGFVLVPWPLDHMVRVSLRAIALDAAPQDLMTESRTAAKVGAVMYFRVTGPLKPLVPPPESHQEDTIRPAQATTVPSRPGQDPLDGLLSERERLGALLQEVIDRHGHSRRSKVSEVAVKAVVELPQEMRRAIVTKGRALQPGSLRTGMDLVGAERIPSVTFPIPFEWMRDLLTASGTSAINAAGRLEAGDGP